jgi:uncharacterized protein YijF (DUF1287 family)
MPKKSLVRGSERLSSLWLMISVLLMSMMSSFLQSVWALSPTQLVNDARSQIGVTTAYDPSYRQLNYPMGDVPISTGVCTDVLIRALRQQNIDLQQRIHDDMRAHFSKYPKTWGLKKPDKNIDHRRVPNIMRYFERRGYQVSDAVFKAGDIVAWDLGKGLLHIGLVSDKTTMMRKTPLIIHNIGAGVQQDDILHRYKIIGHYRIF